MTVFPAYCEVCQTTRRFERPGINHILHLLITIFTCGWWGVVWVFLAIFGGGKAHCIACGNPKGAGAGTKILGGLALVGVAGVVFVMFAGALGAVTKQREVARGERLATATPTPRSDLAPASAAATIRPVPVPTVSPRPTPQPSPSTSPDSQALLAARMVESKRRAIAKYPALSQSGSLLNSKFVAAYQRLLAQKAQRLTEPDWFEKLADEVATAR